MAKEKIYHAFLGQEFIFWLFVKSTEDTFFDLERFGTQSVQIILEEFIMLESSDGSGYTETINSHDITEQADIVASIRIGRLPKTVQVRIIRGDHEWVCVLNALPLTLKSVTLPVSRENDQFEIIHDRLIMLEEIDTIISGLFNLFLLERDSDEFIMTARDFITEHEA